MLWGAHAFDSHPQNLNTARGHNGNHDDNLMSQTHDKNKLASTPRYRSSGNGIFRETFARLSSAPVHQLSSERGIFHIAIDGCGSMGGDATTNLKEGRLLTFHGTSQQAADEILP